MHLHARASPSLLNRKGAPLASETFGSRSEVSSNVTAVLLRCRVPRSVLSSCNALQHRKPIVTTPAPSLSPACSLPQLPDDLKSDCPAPPTPRTTGNPFCDG